MTAQGCPMDAIILAGGTSSRMGTDKLALQRSGRSLLDTVLTGARSQLLALGADPRLVVVGPRPSTTSVPIEHTREQPEGSGPVAALAAGVAHLAPTGADDLVVVLAGDAPAGPDAVPHIVARLERTDEDADPTPTPEAAVLVDGTGRRQPLCAVYRMPALIRALDELGDPRGRGMHELLDHLAVAQVLDTVDAADDVDTPADAARLGFTTPEDSSDT